eukprot:19546-Heterococcus_DN1.PRE.2
MILEQNVHCACVKCALRATFTRSSAPMESRENDTITVLGHQEIMQTTSMRQAHCHTLLLHICRKSLQHAVAVAKSNSKAQYKRAYGHKVTQSSHKSCCDAIQSRYKHSGCAPALALLRASDLLLLAFAASFRC